MLLPHDIAALEEDRMALSMSELADEHLRVGGGVACFGGSPDSWLNLAVGLGMHGPVSASELDSLLAFYDARGVDPKVEVCPFADASLVQGLGARGFRLASFETILSRELRDLARVEAPDDLTFDEVDPSDPDQLRTFVDAHVACFAAGGGPRAEAMAESARRTALHPRVTAWIARLGNDVAGSGGLEVLGTVACLIAAGVLAPYRRRGIQQALIAFRCRVARELGCEVVTIGSRPQSPTGRNALRAGFVTTYTKAILERQPAA